MCQVFSCDFAQKFVQIFLFVHFGLLSAHKMSEPPVIADSSQCRVFANREARGIIGV
jgi:hypothetical protein